MLMLAAFFVRIPMVEEYSGSPPRWNRSAARSPGHRGGRRLPRGDLAAPGPLPADDAALRGRPGASAPSFFFFFLTRKVLQTKRHGRALAPPIFFFFFK